VTEERRGLEVLVFAQDQGCTAAEGRREMLFCVFALGVGDEVGWRCKAGYLLELCLLRNRFRVKR